MAVYRGPAAGLGRVFQGLEVALERPLRSATLLDLLLPPAADLVLRPVPVRDLARRRPVTSATRRRPRPEPPARGSRRRAPCGRRPPRRHGVRPPRGRPFVNCTRSASSRSRSNASAWTCLRRQPRVRSRCDSRAKDSAVRPGTGGRSTPCSGGRRRRRRRSRWSTSAFAMGCGSSDEFDMSLFWLSLMLTAGLLE